MKLRGSVIGRRESELSDDPPQVRIANDRGFDVWLPGDFKLGQEVEVTVTAVLVERPATLDYEGAMELIRRGCSACMMERFPYWHEAGTPCPVATTAPTPPDTGERGK